MAWWQWALWIIGVCVVLGVAHTITDIYNMLIEANNRLIGLQRTLERWEESRKPDWD